VTAPGQVGRRCPRPSDLLPRGGRRPAALASRTVMPRATRWAIPGAIPGPTPGPTPRAPHSGRASAMASRSSRTPPRGLPMRPTAARWYKLASAWVPPLKEQGPRTHHAVPGGPEVAARAVGPIGTLTADA